MQRISNSATSHSNGLAIVKAFAYDPATNTWKSRRAPPVAGPIIRVTLGGQGRLLLVSGTSTYLYTP